jgi:hypothetical protein
LGGVGVTPGVTLTLSDGIDVALKPTPNINTKNKTLKKQK